MSVPAQWVARRVCGGPPTVNQKPHECAVLFITLSPARPRDPPPELQAAEPAALPRRAREDHRLQLRRLFDQDADRPVDAPPRRRARRRRRPALRAARGRHVGVLLARAGARWMIRSNLSHTAGGENELSIACVARPPPPPHPRTTPPPRARTHALTRPSSLRACPKRTQAWLANEVRKLPSAAARTAFKAEKWPLTPATSDLFQVWRIAPAHGLPHPVPYELALPTPFLSMGVCCRAIGSFPTASTSHDAGGAVPKRATALSF